MTQSKGHVLAIGLDGATFDLIRPWIESGLLPTVRVLIQRGASGTLKSTIPPLTPPAWVSSITGVNPGKHGVFDFIKGKERYQQRSLRSSDWKVEPIWRRLSREGFNVGVVNFPLTYPPLAINGFMLSGMLTPSGAMDYAHPPELVEQIERLLGRSRMSLDEKNLSLGNRRAFLKDLQRVTLQQTELASRLGQSFNVNFLQVIYDGVDRVQHYFWQFMNSSSEEAQAILDHYRYLDQGLVPLIASFPPESYVIIYSDHGFGPFCRRIHIETVLADLGMLAWRSDGLASLPRRESLLSKETAEALAYKLGFGTTLKRVLPQSWKDALPRAQAAPYEHINWPQTKAFFASMPNQSIRINLKGREPQGIVEPGQEYEFVCQQIIEGLRALRDPATNQPAIDRVYRREDIYHGPYVEQADDLIVSATPGYHLVGGRSDHVISDPRASRLGWSGTHRSEGILILSGPGVRHGYKLEPSRIEDIAPTMLHLMGLAVPDYMDGRVVTDAFESDFLQARPVTMQPESLPVTPSSSIEGEAEETEVLNRLKDLGYIE
ncbi:MAG: alkaline phosphatase family protein [Acidobacteria bacterium]|nr:alkaline phosphatase family protein [Acidobacteriota bacterium]